MLSNRRILSLGVTSMGHLGRTQKSQAPSEKKLKACACELEQKLEARTRELAESRGLRGAGAADGDLGDSARHLKLARRSAARVRDYTSQRNAHLRGQVRLDVPQ